MTPHRHTHTLINKNMHKGISILMGWGSMVGWLLEISMERFELIVLVIGIISYCAKHIQIRIYLNNIESPSFFLIFH
jgi:hypothetical protein